MYDTSILSTSGPSTLSTFPKNYAPGYHLFILTHHNVTEKQYFLRHTSYLLQSDSLHPNISPFHIICHGLFTSQTRPSQLPFYSSSSSLYSPPFTLSFPSKYPFFHAYASAFQHPSLFCSLNIFIVFSISFTTCFTLWLLSLSNSVRFIH